MSRTKAIAIVLLLLLANTFSTKQYFFTAITDPFRDLAFSNWEDTNAYKLCTQSSNSFDLSQQKNQQPTASKLIDVCQKKVQWDFANMTLRAHYPYFFELDKDIPILERLSHNRFSRTAMMSPWSARATSIAIVLGNWTVMLLALTLLYWALITTKQKNEGMYRLALSLSIATGLIALFVPDPTGIISPFTKVFTYPAAVVLPLFGAIQFVRWIVDGFKSK